MLKRSLVLSVLFALIFVGNTASAAYNAVPGDLLRTADDPTVVLVMDNGSRMPLSADAYAVRYNNNFGLVKFVTTAERGSYNGNIIINSMSSLPSGEVFMYDMGQPGIYIVDNGYKRLFTTWAGFEATGNDFNDVEWTGAYTMYPTGAPVQ